MPNKEFDSFWHDSKGLGGCPLAEFLPCSILECSQCRAAVQHGWDACLARSTSSTSEAANSAVWDQFGCRVCSELLNCIRDNVRPEPGLPCFVLAKPFESPAGDNNKHAAIAKIADEMDSNCLNFADDSPFGNKLRDWVRQLRNVVVNMVLLD